MASQVSPHEQARKTVSNAESAARDNELFERVRVMPGGEQMLPDSGGAMYYRHERLEVRGDMTSFSVLRAISQLCDEYDMHVDREKGRELHGDDYAILRSDPPWK